MKKGRTSRLLLFVSCTMIILFAVCTFLLAYLTGTEISSTLVTAWFSFWGAEIVSLTAIKIGKVKYNYEQNQEEEEE